MISSLSKKVLAQAMLLLTLVIASTKAASPFPSASNPVTRQALELRGGGGGTTTAKALTTLGLVVGTTTSLSAKTVLDKSGFQKSYPVSILTTRRIGGAILSFSLVAYFLLFQQTSASTAVGISVLPTIIDLSKTLLDGTHKELGFPAAGQVFVLMVSSTFSFLFLNDNSPLLSSSKDTLLLKIYAGWLLTNGVLMGCFPKLACQAYGELDASGLPVLQYFVSLWGFSLLSLGTLSGCLGTGMMTTEKVLAVSALPFCSRFIVSKFLS
mmetsp:Transcript_61612/g.70817  ORF Transcript_61612/g.70817 Transcript_61612/m.70817 type:complete len:268 (-) Transcript_61612:160-963(-)